MAVYIPSRVAHFKAANFFACSLRSALDLARWLKVGKLDDPGERQQKEHDARQGQQLLEIEEYPVLEESEEPAEPLQCIMPSFIVGGLRIGPPPHEQV
jgi:hypothetical protein